MNDTKIALISDIHANRWALEAVLTEIQKMRIEKIVNLGDCFYGPLDPEGTAEILFNLGIPTVQGNEDRLLLKPVDNMKPGSTLRFTRDRLGEREMNWLRALPGTAVLDNEIFLCHGSPERDDEYLLLKVTEDGVKKRELSDLDNMLMKITQNLILCGHDHIPASVELSSGKMIINPGSVGCQAFTDDKPFEHKIETGSPDARFCVIEKSDNGWNVEHYSLPYDWKTAAAMAGKNGFDDWAHWILTGRAQ